jgi:hypothetical protein
MINYSKRVEATDPFDQVIWVSWIREAMPAKLATSKTVLSKCLAGHLWELRGRGVFSPRPLSVTQSSSEGDSSNSSYR